MSEKESRRKKRKVKKARKHSTKIWGISSGMSEEDSEVMIEAKKYADERKDSIVYFDNRVALQGLRKIKENDNMMFTGDYGEDIIVSMLSTLTLHPPVGNVIFFKNFLELDSMNRPFCSMFKKFKVTAISLAPIAWFVITDAIRNASNGG